MQTVSRLQVSLALAVLGFAASAAQAVPVIPQNYEYGPVYVGSSSQHSYSHNVGSLAGYDVASATLEIWLSDDGDDDAGWCLIELWGTCYFGEPGNPESVKFRFNGDPWVGPLGVDGVTCPSLTYCDSWDRFGAYDVRAALIAGNGLLNVTVKSDDGDFWFKKSRLTVTLAPPREVPEPAALSLLGVGLLGIGILRRRQRRA